MEITKLEGLDKNAKILVAMMVTSEVYRERPYLHKAKVAVEDGSFLIYTHVTGVTNWIYSRIAAELPKDHFTVTLREGGERNEHIQVVPNDD